MNRKLFDVTHDGGLDSINENEIIVLKNKNRKIFDVIRIKRENSSNNQILTKCLKFRISSVIIIKLVIFYSSSFQFQLFI